MRKYHKKTGFLFFIGISESSYSGRKDYELKISVKLCLPSFMNRYKSPKKKEESQHLLLVAMPFYAFLPVWIAAKSSRKFVLLDEHFSVLSTNITDSRVSNWNSN